MMARLDSGDAAFVMTSDTVGQPQFHIKVCSLRLSLDVTTCIVN